MSENTETVTELPDDAAIDAEVDELTRTPAEQQGDKVKNALIAAKRELRDARRELKDVKPIADRAKEIDEKLTAASPIIAAVQNNPKLLAEALRAANGTRPSGDTVVQPENDAEAAAEAEDRGWFLADGFTPDAARGRRSLDRQSNIVKRHVEELMRPLAGTVIGSRAEQNVQRALQQVDDDGVPLATRESILEAVKQLGPQGPALLANPEVVDHVVTVAMGLDRRLKRTPRSSVEDPIFLDRASARRSAAAVLDDRLKTALERQGVTEKDATATMKRLEHAGRSGVALGE